MRSSHDRRHPEQIAQEAGAKWARNNAIPGVFGLAAELVREETNRSGIAIEHRDGSIRQRRKHVILRVLAVEGRRETSEKKGCMEMGGAWMGDWRVQDERKLGDCFPVMEEKRVFRISMTSMERSEEEEEDWKATSSSFGFSKSSMIRLT